MHVCVYGILNDIRHQLCSIKDKLFLNLFYCCKCWKLWTQARVYTPTKMFICVFVNNGRICVFKCALSVKSMNMCVISHNFMCMCLIYKCVHGIPCIDHDLCASMWSMLVNLYLYVGGCVNVYLRICYCKFVGRTWGVTLPMNVHTHICVTQIGCLRRGLMWVHVCR